jgi:hypothetical protein
MTVAELDLVPSSVFYHQRRAIRDYNAQPAVQAAKGNSLIDSGSIFGPNTSRFDNVTRDEYIQKCVLNALGTFAMVDHMGDWHEKGSMGWWGMNDSTDTSELAFLRSQDDYIRCLSENSPSKYWVAVVDCHI